MKIQAKDCTQGASSKWNPNARTGRRRYVRALVRNTDKERDVQPPDGALTTEFADIRDDDSIAIVAEVMGGLDPTGSHVLELLAPARR